MREGLGRARGDPRAGCGERRGKEGQGEADGRSPTVEPQASLAGGHLSLVPRRPCQPNQKNSETVPGRHPDTGPSVPSGILLLLSYPAGPLQSHPPRKSRAVSRDLNSLSRSVNCVDVIRSGTPFPPGKHFCLP